MFNGFSEETFNFFMALSFNNNVDFFRENHDWYLRAVRQPLLDLAAELSPTALEMDPQFETRPNRCVSRINRDVRFARDKSPYRDHMWIAFHRPGAASDPHLGAYVELRMDGVTCGMGLYDRNEPLMRSFRTLLTEHPRKVINALNRADPAFRLYGNTIQRMKVPAQIPQKQRPWYPLRGFYLEREIRDFSLIGSSALAQDIGTSLSTLKALYRCFLSVYPAEP
ncbi:MAG: DUF2461 domain-containing protein [Clostridia bacterium]|nr:DUF2461 domain-containing protein [Clostridia bacterium]